jgi:hypothetical protein
MQNFRISAPGSGVPLTALDNIIPFAGKRESGRGLFLALFCRAGRANQSPKLGENGLNADMPQRPNLTPPVIGPTDRLQNAQDTR